MDNFVVGLVMIAAIAAIIGYFFLKGSKARPKHSTTSGDAGGDGRGWDGADGGGDGGGGGD